MNEKIAEMSLEFSATQIQKQFDLHIKQVTNF